MKRKLKFDEALPAFADLVADRWGPNALRKNLFLRDASGRLTLVLLDESVAPLDVGRLATEAGELLAPYTDPDGFAVATPDELYDESLRDLSAAAQVTVNGRKFQGNVSLVDRRVVGADWLRSPAKPPSSGPVRIAFASIKGGVGRSTALCVAAAHLAGKGKRVLAIDMDLEAPGLGNMLLPSDTLPRFGLLDYLVESSMQDLDDEFIEDMLGGSWIGGGRGKVTVVPALGQASLLHPHNVLAKLARAYLAGPSLDGTVRTFTDSVAALVERLSEGNRFDAILIDARAGLHETTAAAVVGLGAELFFFGIDQPQTYAGYELLLAHLAQLPSTPDNDWRDRLTFVHAKADPSSDESRQRFGEAFEELFQKYLWPTSPDMSEEVGGIEFVADEFETDWETVFAADLDSVLRPAVDLIEVPYSQLYSYFDPTRNSALLEPAIYELEFREFLSMIDELVETNIAAHAETDGI